MKKKADYFVQVNFDDTGKFGNDFINEFRSDDEKKKIIYINTAVPLEKFLNNEELSKAEKIILMMHIVDKKMLDDIAGDDEDLKEIADLVMKGAKEDPLTMEITSKIVSDIKKENTSTEE